MITPLITIALLVGPWVTVVALGREELAQSAGVVGLSLAFAFFSLGHFVQTKTLADMLPAWTPQRIPIIYATGVLEIVLALALLFPDTRMLAGWACILVLIGFFPANVYAAFARKGGGGHAWGPSYLLIRAPLQLLLIVWAYAFAAHATQIAV